MLATVEDSVSRPEVVQPHQTVGEPDSHTVFLEASFDQSLRVLQNSAVQICAHQARVCESVDLISLRLLLLFAFALLFGFGTGWWRVFQWHRRFH